MIQIDHKMIQIDHEMIEIDHFHPKLHETSQIPPISPEKKIKYELSPKTPLFGLLWHKKLKPSIWTLVTSKVHSSRRMHFSGY